MLRHEKTEPKNSDEILYLCGLVHHSMSLDEFKKLLRMTVTEANRKLDISNNYLCSFGMKLPGIIQKLPATLEYLCLKDNFLADMGLPLLLKTLRVLPEGLKKLDLRGNKLERFNTYQIADIFAAISPNIDLDLGYVPGENPEEANAEIADLKSEVTAVAYASPHTLFGAPNNKISDVDDKKVNQKRWLIV